MRREYRRPPQVYGRVHNETAAGDHCRAMVEVEGRLALEVETLDSKPSIWPRLLALVEEVVCANGDPERREAVIAEMRRWIVLGAGQNRFGHIT